MRAVNPVWIGAILLLCHTSTFGQAADTLHYFGDFKTYTVDGELTGHSLILLEKIYDPARNELIENALLIAQSGEVTQYPSIVLTIADDDTFSASSSDGTISGNGELFGTKGNWSYFVATFQSTNGVTIVDENYFADPTVLTARKTITLPNGSIYSIVEVNTKKVSSTTYDLLSNALLRP